MATCYRHPDRETNVSCSECGRPICPDCMIAAPVGMKCPECARQPRSARISIKPSRMGLAVAVAFIGGAVIGALSMFLVSRIPILGFIAAFVIGIVMGELVYRASGHYRDTQTAWIAAAGGGWAYVFPIVLIEVASPYSVNIGGLGPFYWLGLAIAAFVAYRRVL